MASNKNNLKSLRTIADHKKELAKLEKENRAAYKTIDKLIADNKKKEEEIDHLKKLLEDSVPVLVEDKKPQETISFNITPEETIAHSQLRRLEETAMKRDLTLEETRKYDLLVKNKRLAQEQSTVNLNKQNYKELDDSKLIEIAGAVDESKGKSKS